MSRLLRKKLPKREILQPQADVRLGDFQSRKCRVLHGAIHNFEQHSEPFGQYASSAMSNNQPLFPNPRAVLTDLLSQLRQAISLTDSSNSNPLQDAPSSAKNILLTFHVLYPNEFLSALDLLDRHLLTRVVVRSENPDQRRESNTAEPTTGSVTGMENNNVASMAVAGNQQPHRKKTPLYFVRSAQQPRKFGTGRTYDPLATHYEVRPTAWNCSCPALVFAAFPSGIGIGGSTPSDLQEEGNDEGRSFGGLSNRSANGMPPACKHLLACVLAEQCDVFKGFVEQKEISAEELAGWCAGW